MNKHRISQRIAYSTTDELEGRIDEAINAHMCERLNYLIEVIERRAKEARLGDNAGIMLALEYLEIERGKHTR